jgi:hypothetical protein
MSMEITSKRAPMPLGEGHAKLTAQVLLEVPQAGENLPLSRLVPQVERVKPEGKLALA